MFRNVKTADLVLLWARAAGMCSHPDCKVRLVLEGHEDDPAVTLGDAAHIIARSDGGPRGDPGAPNWRRNGYENLILLCGHHHAMIDKAASRFSVEDLRAWKAEHEGWVKEVTRHGGQAVPWTAIVQDPEGRVDLEEAAAAMGAGNRAERTIVLRGEAAEAERVVVERAIAETPAERRRFAVFSLGRIPLAVQLGFVLGDRTRAEMGRSREAPGEQCSDRGTWTAAAATTSQ